MTPHGQDLEIAMPTGRVKWFSLEKGFRFISSDEGVAEGRRGPQALSVRIVDAPPSISGSRGNTEDLAILIEESIKMLDRVGNNLRHGRAPNEAEASRVAKVLRGIAGQIEGTN